MTEGFDFLSQGLESLLVGEYIAVFSHHQAFLELFFVGEGLPKTVKKCYNELIEL